MYVYESDDLGIDIYSCDIGYIVVHHAPKIDTPMFKVFTIWINQHTPMCERYTHVYFWKKLRINT